MSSAPSASQPRRQLAAELRRLRGERTLADVARQLGWSESKLSRIETGRLNISRDDLEQLADVYATTDQVKARLAGLRTRKQEWWEPYTEALSDPYEAYIAMESRASTILAYEAQIVFGLLQTDEYANVVMHTDTTPRDQDTINRRVQVRMARQAVLIREPQPTLRVVLDEAVLRRPIGGPEIFKRQLLRLIEASLRPNVSLQVLTFAVGAHRALAGSFILLEFPDGADPLAYSEGVTGGVIRSDPDDVKSYRQGFDDISAVALSPEDSRGLIEAAAHELPPA